MSLEEYADIEMAQLKEREQREKDAPQYVSLWLPYCID
jgi:hypothetical protein